MPGAPDCRPEWVPNGDCPCAGSSAARGTRAYCCCPHYLTEVSQQGLAAHVEAVYLSVSLGENSQLAGKAARPPARSSFHQWLG
jgi:hypothetical protein